MEWKAMELTYVYGTNTEAPRYPSFWQRRKSRLAIVKLTQELELGDRQET